MIISKTQFNRVLEKAGSEPNFPDKQFLFNCFANQLNKKYKEVLSAICQTDAEFQKHLSNAKVVSVESIGVEKPNTVIRFELPPNGRIRGVSEMFYDRVTLSRYFGIGADITRVGSVDNSNIDSFINKEVIIDWNEWMEHTNNGTLSTLVHNRFGYTLGRTFSHQGIILTYEPKSGHYRTHHPLALLLPEPSKIVKGWERIENIKTVKKGTVEYQDLSVYVRLVSNKHLFIEDGEALILVKLRRQTHHYNKKHEGKEHVDG